MRRNLGLLLITFIVTATAPAWASHRYHYLLSSGAPATSSVAPMTFSFYWESDTLLLPPPPACTGEINPETLPNYTATISNPEFTVNSIGLCYGTSSYPLAIGISWNYPGGTSPNLFYFYSAGTPGVETHDTWLFGFTIEPAHLVALDVYPAATLSITDTWAVPLPPTSVCLLCIISVQITAGPVVPAPGTPVEATVGLTDLSGTPIGSPQPVTIVPGQVTSVDFEPAALVSAAVLSTHQDVIPVVTIANPLLTTPPLQVTTETSLNGLPGQLVSGGVSVPASTLAPQSIGAGEVLHMIAVASSPNPCVAILAFTNATGAVVGGSASITLNPGQAQTLDLDASSLSLQIGKRAVIQPVVQLPMIAPPAAAVGVAAPVTSVCSVTSEVIDKVTGLTLTYQTAFLQ